MSDADAAQLIAGAALVLLIIGLAIASRKDVVATRDAEYTPPGQSPRTVTAGSTIPKDEAVHVPQSFKREQRRSALGAILAGKDNRTSTSKTVAFAWTIAIAFGLLSLVVAVWLGDHTPWDNQVDRGLQEEYLLLLGGPYAAAILAKYAAVSQAETKTDAPVGSANASQLVTDDQGDTDLGDFQYILFNVIALAFFFGDFIGDLGNGFPVLPAILTGLVLTSAGGYGAKKLVAQAAPTLTSVVPPAAPPDTEIKVFAVNLSVPSNVSGTGQTMKPTVLIGSHEVEVTAQDIVLGNDRLTIKVPDEKPGSAPITAARADGAAARASNGANALPFEILPKPVSQTTGAPGTPGADTGVAEGNGQDESLTPSDR